ncbi:alpha/beta hydrolase [Pseudoalteromonas denitrificans]|uniref:Lysophospholipase, alpha-beta hydrolase superfamily n=1 Tax=Pseudoalteromonas denitrificans DSM 6059 TaxID=1123010 RepID=A0A1I1I6U7_9GAMM|nr:alpha/beta fold hydrolase [Pseudoalteromonas denitrificans]SFC32149.1 Lysophospholipase, alpha-beta hydrolase superfamily [Pseudoalteromonas denitrificans DSM 6059]
MLMEKMTFLARDGIQLAYDTLTAINSKATMIFLHGSTYNSRRYANIAKTLHAQSYDTCLLNWRGHGASEGEMGNVDYIGQLEDDLADFIAHYQKQSNKPLVIAGHSAGAVICLRYINKYGCDKISAVSFIAPAINGPLETARYKQKSAKWQYRISYFRAAKPSKVPPASALQHAPNLNMLPFIAAKLLPFMRTKAILRFPASERMARLEGRILNYSYNLMLSCDINNYPAAFNKVTVPVLMLCGEQDEVIHENLLNTIFHWHLPQNINKKLIELPKVNHMKVVPAACKILPDWLNDLFPSTALNLQKTNVNEVLC